MHPLYLKIEFVFDRIVCQGYLDSYSCLVWNNSIGEKNGRREKEKEKPHFFFIYIYIYVQR
jgi:hypothetical protein